MTRALAWIRKSKGSDDDIGLEQQREKVPAVAEEIADEVDVLDLGVQTGFSTMKRDAGGETLLDERSDVKQAVEALEAGEYDYLVARDDKRVCRDEYFNVIEYACKQGGCEMVFLSDDVQRDDLVFSIRRDVDTHTKRQEIKESIKATKRRMQNGCYQGTPPFGLKFHEDGCHLVKDEEAWEQVEEIMERRQAGDSIRVVADTVEVSTATVSRVSNRGMQYYEEKLADYGV